MKKLNNINTVGRYSGIFANWGVRSICYTINNGEDNEAYIEVKLPEYYRFERSDEIIDQASDFVNGFKVVLTKNGEYGYVREEDNVLLPFRYDVAFDFNKYGFAIVGKNGDVSWINKDFKYLNSKGEMVEDSFDNKFAKFDGWQEIGAFSSGDIALSRVYDGRNSCGKVAYFGENGKLKEFYRYNGKINENDYVSFFNRGSKFDEKGHAMADKKMLFSKGYYISFKDLIDISIEKGFIDRLSDDAEKVLKKV